MLFKDDWQQCPVNFFEYHSGQEQAGRKQIIELSVDQAGPKEHKESVVIGEKIFKKFQEEKNSRELNWKKEVYSQLVGTMKDRKTVGRKGTCKVDDLKDRTMPACCCNRDVIGLEQSTSLLNGLSLKIFKLHSLRRLQVPSNKDLEKTRGKQNKTKNVNRGFLRLTRRKRKRWYLPMTPKG